MNKRIEVVSKSQQLDSEADTQHTEPFLEWKYKLSEKTGEFEFDSMRLSDGSEIKEKSLKKALKRATGTLDLRTAETILNKVARGMSADRQDIRINDASALLTALRPKDESDALLLGQFLALQDSGMKCLRLANLPEQGFYHVERLLMLAHKLFNTANLTMQTVLKYRSGGQQTVQVIHVHNEGQAIVAQNLSSQHAGEGMKK